MKRRFVFDATPLIHLAKAGLAPLIVDLAGDKLSTPAVIDEVVGRTEEGEFEYPDAGIISSLVEEGVIQVRKPGPKDVRRLIRRCRDIHGGEAEVLALANELGAIAVIDDRAARAAARIRGVRLEGTKGVVLRAEKKGSIRTTEAEDALGKLVSSGWRCDAELFSALLKALRAIRPPSRP